MNRFRILKPIHKVEYISDKTIYDLLDIVHDAEYEISSEYNDDSNISGLIYTDPDRDIKIYRILSFDDAAEHGHEKWCTTSDVNKFCFYIRLYKIWIIEDGSRKDNSPYHRVCYLKNNIEDMFVGGDNIHYFENTEQYRYLTEYYGHEIMNILK